MSLTQDIPMTEILSPAGSMPLFAASPPALPWCSTCQRPHIPLAGSCPEPEPCPDCEAGAGRSCYPDCLRYAEGV